MSRTHSIFQKKRRASPAHRSAGEISQNPSNLSSVQDLGRFLMIAGAIVVIAGFVLWKFGGFGPLGRLPGDVNIQKENFSFHFPLVTCLLISAALTLLAWLFRR